MHRVEMIHRHDFEAFTFKKLAEAISTTEAGVYRYFENKHYLLMYIVAWYWSWLEYRVIFRTNNIDDPVLKLNPPFSFKIKIAIRHQFYEVKQGL